MNKITKIVLIQIQNFLVELEFNLNILYKKFIKFLIYNTL